MNLPIEPMSSDLLRQRRNIIILSAILWFLRYAKIEITKFSMLGIEFSKFENPNAVFLALWIVWIYFFIRYYQYFSQEGFPKIKTALMYVINNKSEATINKIVQQEHPDYSAGSINYSTLKNWK